MAVPNRFALMLVYMLPSIAFVSGAAAQDIARTEDPMILGKWTTKANSKDGPITLVKEHANGTTTLTAFDATKRVLYSKTSEYRTEKHGNVRVFVFSNSQYIAGPNAGKIDKRTKSYVYRVDGRNFFEVRGMVVGTNEPPAIVVWEREDSPAT